MISNNRGSVLIIVYMVIAALTIMGTAFVSRGVNEIQNTRRHVNTVKAFWLAEAGINKSLYEANHAGAEVNWPGSDQISDVTITNLSSTSKLINVTGYCENATSTVSIIAEQSGSVFNYAAFGKTSVTMSGQGDVNSYNSTSDPTASSLLSNGDVGTNDELSMSGQAYVFGDAGTGSDCIFEDEDHNYVSGEVSHDTDVSVPEVSVPSSLSGLALGSAVTSSWSPDPGDYRIPSISLSSKSVVTLTGPTNLYLTSTGTSLSVTGQANIVISSASTGPVTIYTDGDISLAGQGITNSAVYPSMLLIYGTSSTSQSFQCSGQGDFSGVFYGPNTDISLSGQGDLFGSFIGDTVSITGQGDIRYDEALKDLDVGIGSFSIRSWKEGRSF